MEKTFFESYNDYACELTEAPPQFHWANGLILLGQIIGRKKWVGLEDYRLYPNFYIVLVGSSGLSRKTTSMRLAKGVLRAVQTHEEYETAPRKKQILWQDHVASLEGFFEVLKEQESEYHQAQVVIALEELSSLLSKSRQEGTQNLLSGLTELYDSGPIHRRTMQSRVEIQNPLVSILAGTTKDDLFKQMKKSDFIGGFGNRFMYIVGESSKEIPWPESSDPSHKNEVVHFLQELRKFSEDSKGPVSPQPSAKNYFGEFYHELREEFKKESEASYTLKRLEEHIKKIALVYSVTLFETEISLRAMAYACKIGEEIKDSTKDLFEEFGVSQEILIERRIERHFEETLEMTKRQLQRRFNQRVSTRTLNQIISNLIQAEKLRFVKSNGKKVLQWQRR